MRHPLLMLLLAGMIVGCAPRPAPREASSSHEMPDAGAEARVPPERPAPALGTLAGSYQVTGMEFEELTLSADGTFQSHLHARPFTSGTWTQEGASIVLKGADGSVVQVTAVERRGKIVAGSVEGKPVEWTPLP
jgi:hypothetical protein